MEFTFGIITGHGSIDRVNTIIQDIENLRIPKYEIVIVGGEHISRDNVVHVPFDDSIKSGWITKKKNLITQNARFENITYAHDYITYSSDWYNGFLEFGNDFDVCMNRIINVDGTRYRDWLIWPHNDSKMDEIMARQRGCMIPYTMTHLSKYMYISGAYWAAKKHVMEKYKLDESLCWAQSEDVVWSKQVREEFDFKMNPLSSVKMMKYKEKIFFEADQQTISEILNLEPIRDKTYNLRS